MDYNIAVISGDGVGPEIVEQAILVLKKIGELSNENFRFNHVLAGGSAIDATGEPLPNETLEVCRESDAILLGALGGPKWDSMDSDKRPEQALLRIRKQLDLYANIRPAILYKELKDACPLKSEIIGDGLDICVIRELTGGIYFGEKGRRIENSVEAAYDVEIYNTHEVKRIAKVAFETAMKRDKRVTSVDKANVLESSRLWRSVVEEVSRDYPDVTLNHMYIDNAAMQLVKNPRQFDVIVTGNMFGDILSDEASVIAGSIGMLPSASLGNGNKGMYEPIHGSAPDIAGEDKANPIATILSAAMMLRLSFGLDEEANAIEQAVSKVLTKGYRTQDIMGNDMKLVGTKEMGRLIIEELRVS